MKKIIVIVVGSISLSLQAMVSQPFSERLEKEQEVSTQQKQKITENKQPSQDILTACWKKLHNLSQRLEDLDLDFDEMLEIIDVRKKYDWLLEPGADEDKKVLICAIQELNRVDEELKDYGTSETIRQKRFKITTAPS